MIYLASDPRSRHTSNHHFHKRAPFSGRDRVEQQYPRTYEAIVMGNTANPTVILRANKGRRTLVINTEPQPWQKHDAKLKERQASHRGWNERREARESRKTLEAQFAGMQP